MYMILNAHWEALVFELPKAGEGRWQRWVDTARPSPEDILPWENPAPVTGATYRAGSRSVVVLYVPGEEKR